MQKLAGPLSAAFRSRLETRNLIPGHTYSLRPWTLSTCPVGRTSLHIPSSAYCTVPPRRREGHVEAPTVLAESFVKGVGRGWFLFFFLVLCFELLNKFPIQDMCLKKNPTRLVLCTYNYFYFEWDFKK